MGKLRNSLALLSYICDVKEILCSVLDLVSHVQSRKEKLRFQVIELEESVGLCFEICALTVFQTIISSPAENSQLNLVITFLMNTEFLLS